MASNPESSSKVSSSASKLPVVVVGAGISGLYAAHLLQHVHNVKVVVLEASKKIGGRVVQERLWNRDYDVGAEFMHGGNTILRELVDKLEMKHQELFCLPERSQSVWFYLGRERKLLAYDTKDKDIVRMRALLNTTDAHGQRGDDQSMLKYLVQNEMPFRVLGLADALYAKTYGTDLQTLGVQEYFRSEQRWDERNYGQETLRATQSFRPVLDYLRKEIVVRTDWQVKEINYTDLERITLTNQHGEVLQATRVVVSVPLTVLQDRDIKFIPSLPEEKMTAARALQMDSAVKVLIKFSKKFWPSTHATVFCADTFIPQYWTFDSDSSTPATAAASSTATAPSSASSSSSSPSPTASSSSPTSVNVICGFASGDLARNISSMPSEAVVDSFLKQLDAIYASPQYGTTPASSSYMDAYLADWGKNPHIRGAYSVAKVGATVLHRQLLGQNVAGYLFFCGEAVSSYAPATIHGAMESAAQAVDELITFKRQKKSLLAKKRSKMSSGTASGKPLLAPGPTDKSVAKL